MKVFKGLFRIEYRDTNTRRRAKIPQVVSHDGVRLHIGCGLQHYFIRGVT